MTKRNYQKKQGDKNRKQYDKTTKPKEFEENDLVWCFKPTLSAKLATKVHENKYIGPFRITKKLFPHEYDIQDLGNFKNAKSVNANRFKLFREYLIFQEGSEDESKPSSYRDLKAPEEQPPELDVQSSSGPEFDFGVFIDDDDSEHRGWAQEEIIEKLQIRPRENTATINDVDNSEGSNVSPTRRASRDLHENRGNQDDHGNNDRNFAVIDNGARNAIEDIGNFEENNDDIDDGYIVNQDVDDLNLMILNDDDIQPDIVANEKINDRNITVTENGASDAVRDNEILKKLMTILITGPYSNQDLDDPHLMIIFSLKLWPMRKIQ
jgi:hypothetical protein